MKKSKAQGGNEGDGANASKSSRGLKDHDQRDHADGDKHGSDDHNTDDVGALCLFGVGKGRGCEHV